MAVQYQIPPWIQAPDIAQEFSRGVQIGQQAAFEQQRLQMQQEENQRAHLMEQQRLEVEKSYRDQELAMRKQQLDQAAKLNALKVQDAARQLTAQKAYADFVTAGGDPTEGLLKFGPAMGESMAGYAGLAKDITQAKHPFVPSEMTTAGGTRMVQLSPGRYQVAPPTQTGPISGQSVLDQSGKPIPGIVAVPGPKGMEYRNIPQTNTKRIEKEMQKIEDSWSDNDIEGTKPPDSDIAKAAWLLDQKRYKRLKVQLEGTKPSAQEKTPEAKLEAANALRKAHPDWTKQQIIDAVNQ